MGKWSMHYPHLLRINYEHSLVVNIMCIHNHFLKCLKCGKNTYRSAQSPCPARPEWLAQRPILSKDFFKILKHYLNIFFAFLRKPSKSLHINASFFARGHFYFHFCKQHLLINPKYPSINFAPLSLCKTLRTSG